MEDLVAEAKADIQDNQAYTNDMEEVTEDTHVDTVVEPASSNT